MENNNPKRNVGKRPRANPKKNNTTKDVKNTNTPKTDTKPKPRLYNEKEIPSNYLVPCTSCFKGKLIYVSKRTQGYQEEWDFGQTAYIEFIELQTMVRTDRKFFENNWLYIEDLDVIKALNLDKYYKNILKAEDFDDFFKKSPTEIEKRLKEMSNEIRISVVVRAIEMIEAGTLDSIKVIDTIERVTGYDIREK